jgi:ABC-2 type transport system ATP-binding protein
MTPILEVENVKKIYDNGFQALKGVSLSIDQGEILALLGPNGAGKTTLIGAICGLVQYTSGRILVEGLDHQEHYKTARSKIGLVPQELTRDAFETVWNTIRFSQDLFGGDRDSDHLNQLLEQLSLADKKHSQLRMLSGGMKRRVMIAKALAHKPSILFLDEPTAGVDVELRKSMWEQIRQLKESGVTIILTTHYIEEAEMMADRVAVINQGEILLVDTKEHLMNRFGKKYLEVELEKPLESLPEQLTAHQIRLGEKGRRLIYQYDAQEQGNHLDQVLATLNHKDIQIADISTRQSSLEDIFVDLVGGSK